MRQLRSRLRELCPHFLRYQARDVDWWFQKLVAEHRASAAFNPDDFNPNRFKWAAQSAVAKTQEYRRLQAEVAELKRCITALRKRCRRRSQ